MSKSTTFQTLLDDCETPLQTHIILAQLAMLRKLDKDRQPRGFASAEALLTAVIGFGVVLLGLFLIGYVIAHPSALLGLPEVY